MRNNWSSIKSAAFQVRTARETTDGLSRQDYESLANIAEQLEEIADRARPDYIIQNPMSPKYRIGQGGDIEVID